MLYNPINKNQKIVASRRVIFFTFCSDFTRENGLPGRWDPEKNTARWRGRMSIRTHTACLFTWWMGSGRRKTRGRLDVCIVGDRHLTYHPRARIPPACSMPITPNERECPPRRHKVPCSSPLIGFHSTPSTTYLSTPPHL
jgi:hypothetical protein